DNETTALREKVRARSGRKRHSLVLQEIKCGLAIYELLATGCFLGVLTRAGRAYPARGLIQRVGADVDRAADKTRRNSIFLCEKVAALFADRDDRNRIRLDFYLQASLTRNVAERFAQWNFGQGNRDSRFARRNW